MKIAPAPETQELAWVQMMRQGETRGFDALFRQYSARLYRFAYVYLRSRAVAEEIVQDCFLKVWEKRATLREDVPLKGYLFTIAYNAVLNQLRQQQRHQQYATGLGLTEASAVEPGNDVEYAELKELYHAAIEQLPPKRRQVFVMSREQGLSYAEIAAEIGLSVKTVEAQMSQSLKFLSAYMKARGIRLSVGLVWWLMQS